MIQGDLVGAFEIDRPARSGGMASVYRAIDRTTGRAVAVKILPDPAEEERDRFLREARILADLRHPAIVTYVGHGTAPGGEPYLAMEWLEGEDLGERLRRAGLTVDESVRLGERIAGALAAAHGRGVVHRDIKPANIFLPDGDVGRAKIVDFGVARPLPSMAGSLTRTGMLVGTPSYMAPEQVRGRDVDARADLFALGCVLYECLAGRPAFVAEHLLGVLARVLFEESPRVADVRPDVPGAVDDLVARLLAKEPGARPADAHAVASALAALGPLAGGAAPRAPARLALSTVERRVVSVVFAGRGGRWDAGDTVLGADPWDAETVDHLHAVARRFGATLERVTRGTLAAAVAGRGSATDRAGDAARLALAMGTLLPDTPIAIATGRAVVGGSLPVSDAIDRAAELLDAHGAGIWLDAVTASLVEGAFEVDADSRLAGERAERARTLLGRPTPCVGRDAELSMLDALYRECAAAPAARAVLVTAVPGTGKSRLKDEWLARLASRRDPGLVLVCRGDPMSAGAPFGQAAQAVRAAAGLSDGAPPAEQRDKLRARLDALGVPERAATFLGELVGVPEAGAATRDAVLLGDQMRLAWEDWLAAECAARPVILVLEDLQWGDAPSVQFVDAALRNLPDRPLLVLALGRRDVYDLYPGLWAERGLQEIRLPDLPRRAAERLARDVLGDAATADTVAWICDRAAGNALYLEELIRAVAEGHEGQVPESVLAMVEARLGSLPSVARRVLRAASVFGEAFWGAGVAALVGGERDTAEWLADLEGREIVIRRRDSRFPGEVEYGFRHALHREAAYGMLTAGDRALGHRLAAEWLVAGGERQALVLAEHFERGGVPARAVEGYTRAAEEALEGNDFAGSLERAARGAACGAAGEVLGKLRLLQAEAHNWRGEKKEAEWSAAGALPLLPRGTTSWYNAARQALAAKLPAPLALLERATTALSETPATDDARPAYVMLATTALQHLLFHGDRGGARALVEAAEAVGATRPDGDVTHAWLDRARAYMLDFDGAHDAGRAHYLRAAARFEAALDYRTACTLRCNVGWLEATELGMHEHAERTLHSALALAIRLGLTRYVSTARQNLGVAVMRQGRLQEAEQLLRDTVDDFVRQRDPRMEGGSRFYLTILYGLAGNIGRAEEEGRLALALARDIPTTRACSLAALSRVLVAAGRGEEGLALAREAAALLALLGGIEEGEALIRLALAEALHAVGDESDARAHLATAAARVRERAARIADPEVKRAFLETMPDNARTLALAAVWLTDGGAAPAPSG